ncbi:carbohydrate kinase family protein [Streptomyces sp. WMMB 322]|uniref:carbohydrate kinase family protein n=1 Tax=Streptomyces sp. WMMB 322 TaxID=1286821 RepID=UPI0006E2AC88|nr:carbohydrate kinase family protein [Streptomyces sp. WMMB 322]SCK56518.1 sulfofructose kinase [Streptomyces sp. WMMB 322]
MSMHQEPLVFVGVATLDTIAMVDHMPGPDERRKAEAMVRAGGGPAATAAVAAVRLGMPDVRFVGAVGEDEDGERVLAGLAEEGVDVSGVIRVPAHPTGASVVVVDSSRDTRAICNRPGPEFAIRAGSAAADALRAASWVHVDQVGWDVMRDQLAEVLDHTAQGVPRISVDAGNAIPGYAPRGVALDVPNEASLLARYGASDLDDALGRAVGEGAGCVVATLGPRGSVALTADGDRVSAPGVAADVVSTLGAGDVFHGALLSAVVRGEPLGFCLAYANAVAALSCRALDGRSQIPSHQEATAVLNHSVSAARSAETHRQKV